MCVLYGYVFSNNLFVLCVCIAVAVTYVARSSIVFMFTDCCSLFRTYTLLLLQIVEISSNVATSTNTTDTVSTAYDSICKDITLATSLTFPRRFGHSSTVLQHLTKHDAATGVYESTCLFAGGSNGSDLLRNGQDYQDIWLLKLSANTTPETTTSVISDSSCNSVTAEWIPIVIYGDTVRPARYTLGRCHTAELVGTKVLFFGGSAKLDNTIQVFDTDACKVSQNSGDSALMYRLESRCMHCVCSIVTPSAVRSYNSAYV
jgi:hypothetical protein